MASLKVSTGEKLFHDVCKKAKWLKVRSKYIYFQIVTVDRKS